MNSWNLGEVQFQAQMRDVQYRMFGTAAVTALLGRKKYSFRHE